MLNANYSQSPEHLREFISGIGNFVYWHVHEVLEETIAEAITNRSSIELDISFDEDSGQAFIGHPKNFYTEVKNIPLPNNINVDLSLEMLKNAPEVVVVLDCKDERAIPTIEKFIAELGVERCILHAFIGEWGKPYPENIEPEAHWQVEDVSLESIKKLQSETGVFTIGAIRGFNAERMLNGAFLENAISSAKANFSSLSIYLPGTEIPPHKLLAEISTNGYYPWLNIDKLTSELEFNYIGMTDNPESASNIRI